jgi:hypothetical protein
MGHFCFNENYIPEYVQNTLVSLLYCTLLLNPEKLLAINRWLYMYMQN